MPLPRKQCLTKQIWECCIFRKVWLMGAHIPGKENTEADKSHACLEGKPSGQYKHPFSKLPLTN